MSETVTITREELRHLEDRAKKSAMEKSYLQLVIRLMNRISTPSGLDDTVDCMLRSIVDVMGGANIILYVWHGERIFSVDVYGRKKEHVRIDDDEVQQVFVSRQPIEFEHDFSDTRMTTPEFTKAYTWVYPLMVGPELLGVLKMDSLHMGMGELYKHLPTFFNFAALVLKNSMDTESLRETTVFLNTLLEALPIPVFYKDADCRYLGFNRTYEELIGMSREQLLGKTVFDIAPPELAEIYHEKDTELLCDHGTQVYESSVRDIHGEIHEVIFHKAVFTGGNGAVRGLIGAILDITERKKAEEKLHMQAMELEQEVAERQRAQEALLDQAMELAREIEERRLAQDELRRLNDRLEQRVRERTSELCETNRQLQAAYDELKITQARLLQQDKMASIGQLAAGVAHEINNPMGFIISNLSSLGRYTEKIGAYLDAIERHCTESEPATGAFVAEQGKKFKIAPIRQDLPALIGESLDGAERVRRIVQDLKSFSRVDSAEFSEADLNEGIESTLSIVWNELKYKATVVRDYGELPRVWCNPGQLNQVFINILVNAAQAMESQGEIRIETRAQGDTVSIVISDTGSGMPKEVIDRIFDPFFTTKEVGKGTGLGLAIVYDIVVNKHSGMVQVDSTVGTGTSFTITLPVGGQGAYISNSEDSAAIPPSPVE